MKHLFSLLVDLNLLSTAFLLLAKGRELWIKTTKEQRK